MLQDRTPTPSRYFTANLLLTPRAHDTGTSWSCHVSAICFKTWSLDMLSSSSQGILRVLTRCTMLQMLAGLTSRMAVLCLLEARCSSQVISLTCQGTALEHWLYLEQSQVCISSLLIPQPMQSGNLLRRASFLNSHFLPSKVSSLPSRPHSPLVTSFMASMASKMPTSPGTMPTTPRVEQPPALSCQLPQRHLQHRLVPPNAVSWAYQPMQAPLSSLLPVFMQQSLTMQRQAGLSDPSITRSYSSSASTVCSLMKGCLLTTTWGLMLKSVCFRDSVFYIPILSDLWPTCRCRLLISTTSESNSPRVPTPAAARYSPRGHPTPPAPTMPILALSNFSCPSQEIYLSSIWREYLSTVLAVRGCLRLVGIGGSLLRPSQPICCCVGCCQFVCYCLRLGYRMCRLGQSMCCVG